jgi:hypothetical protein
MKTIQPVSIWDNGKTFEAKILNVYGTDVTLGANAMFTYILYSENQDGTLGERLRSGNMAMTGEAYTKWEIDSYVWDWAAKELNLVITGEYIPPVPPVPVPPTPEITEPTIIGTI